MAKIYRPVGSLTQILDELESKEVTDIKSLKNILIYREKSENILQQHINGIAEKTVIAKIESLKDQIPGLNQQFDRKNIEFQQLSMKKTINPLKKLFITLELRKMQKNIGKLALNIEDNENELNYLVNNTDIKIREISNRYAEHTQVIKSVIEENSFLISGAIGEEKALAELRKLPETYYIINDFRYRFPKAIQRRQNGDWIKSIQADHLVIGPPGVFIIETKNWSSESIENTELFSPIEQIRRHSHALFILLNNRLNMNSFQHHWDKQKINVNNILLMVNATPNKNFQFVKTCSLANLRSYITRFEPKLNEGQTRELTVTLLNICKDKR